ncbi:hypothetical protein Tco_0032178 [Tanacetum coccineum]
MWVVAATQHTLVVLFKTQRTLAGCGGEEDVVVRVAVVEVVDCGNGAAKLDNQKFEIGVELFCEVLYITPRVPNQEFIEPPPHDELVSFVKELGYTGSLELVSKMYIDQMYQPWRNFLSIINRCLSRKSTKLIWEDFQFQIDRRQTIAKRREQMPYPRFTKVIINHFLSKHITIPKRHDSFVNTIKYDSVLGKFKFVNKGEEHQNKNTKSGKAKGKGLMGNKKPDANVQKEKKDAVRKKDVVPRKKRSITIADNILPDPDEAIKLVESISLTKAEHQDEERRLPETHANLFIGRELNLEAKKVADTKKTEETEDDEVAPLIRRQTGVVIGRGVPKESVLNLKRRSRASREEYILKQIPKGPSEGSTTVQDTPVLFVHDDKSDEFDWGSEDKADEEIANKEIADEEIADEELAEEEKSKEDRDEDADQAMNDQARTEQVGGAQDKAHEPEPAVPNPSSSLTLSSVEYGNQFINENPDVSITDIFKDSTEIEIQSMVDVPIHQEDPVVQRTPLIDTVILMIPKRSTPTPTPPTTEAQVTHVSESDSSSKVVQRLSEIEKKVEALSRLIMLKQLKNPYKLTSFQENEMHLDLYNSLIGLIGLDEAIAKGETDPTKVLKKRHHNDKDQDPPVDTKKEKKRRRRKDTEPSKKHTASPDSSKAEEPVKDDVVNVEEQPQDDATPKQDNPIWFKQDAVVRPETTDPDWHKESNANEAPEQNWFNELVMLRKIQSHLTI